MLVSYSIMTRALNDLPNLLGPLLEGIGKSLKMHISVFIGGPEPIQNGNINAIRSVSIYLTTSTMELMSVDRPLASITVQTRHPLPRSGLMRTLNIFL